MILMGSIGLTVSFLTSSARAWVNILTINFYFICIGLFGTFLLALKNIAAASFATPYRKVLEALSATVPPFSLSMLTVLLGSHTLYEWTHKDVMVNDKILVQKMAYLNLPFFSLRMAGCLAVWSLFTWLFIRKYRQQESMPDRAAEIQRQLVGRSAFAMIVFALTFSVASFDWIMSLEPHWYSTIFVIFTFSGLLISGIAFLILMLIHLQSKGYLVGAVNENHFHDLGKLLFAFSTFWAYIWFCQYLLMWYANIPEEAEYFVLREHYGWAWFFWINPIINWGIPFLMLMSRDSKRNVTVLHRVSWVILFGQLLNVYLMVAPKVFEQHGLPGPSISWQEIFIVCGYAGMFLWVFFKRLGLSTMLPQNSPLLEEGMNLEQ